MKNLLLLLLIVPFVYFGQTKDEIELCAFVQANKFSTDIDAEKSLDKILKVIGGTLVLHVAKR